MGDVINIAQLKKVNSLANTLNKHGLAVNRQDAAELAKEFNGGGEMDYLNGLKVNEKQEMEVVHTSNGQQMVLDKHNMEKPSETSDFMTKPQVESILQKFCDLFSEEMSQLNAQIKGLEIKFNYLQEQLMEAATSQSEQQIQPVQPLPQEMQQPYSPQTTLNSEPENNIIASEPENNVNIQAQPQFIQTTEPQQAQPVQQPVQVPPTSTPVNEDPNHKTGGYDSNDVCVEKFFYYGVNK
ncbi:hypothetical protein HOC35_05530 [Candidatus Woesearchaeota archaeon]|jgi:hypothetical protein|nr:hypothetical protein [Candidatus Woesearchaeota archaeon]